MDAFFAPWKSIIHGLDNKNPEFHTQNATFEGKSANLQIFWGALIQ